MLAPLLVGSKRWEQAFLIRLQVTIFVLGNGWELRCPESFRDNTTNGKWQQDDENPRCFLPCLTWCLICWQWAFESYRSLETKENRNFQMCTPRTVAWMFTPAQTWEKWMAQMAELMLCVSQVQSLATSPDWAGKVPLPGTSESSCQSVWTTLGYMDQQSDLV